VTRIPWKGPVSHPDVVRGYPRERNISWSGAGELRYMNGRRLFVAVPVPSKRVPQGARYIREWGGGTPLYERQAVIRGGPSGVRTHLKSMSIPESESIL